MTTVTDRPRRHRHLSLHIAECKIAAVTPIRCFWFAAPSYVYFFGIYVELVFATSYGSPYGRMLTQRIRAVAYVKRKTGEKKSSYRALLISQNKTRFYFATIPVDELFPYCFVARREADPLQGFQRSLNESRADDISQYLSDGTGSIPSNIVLSAQSISNLKYSARAGSISFTPAKLAFLVLDGQHRLWGYHKCPVRHRIPVAIYSGLSRAVEAKLFIDINTTQRGVPAALLLDIKQLAEIESSKETILRALFDRLQADATSPLSGKLSPSKSVTGAISRVTFNRAVSPLLSSGVLVDVDHDSRYRVLVNYLNAFEAELPDKGKQLLLRSAYFEAICEVLDEVVRTAVGTKNNAKQESIQEVVRPLAKLDFSGAAGRGGLPTKRAIASAMQTALRKTVALSGDML
jgi:DGQHR domain-containing protein